MQQPRRYAGLPFLILSFFLLTGLFYDLPAAAAKPAVLKGVAVREDPLRILLSVSRKTPFKLIPVEKKEILMALKGVVQQENLKIEGGTPGNIANIAVETLHRDVVAVVVTGRQAFEDVTWHFDESGRYFAVALESQTGQKKAKAVPDKQRAREDETKRPVQEKAADKAAVPPPGESADKQKKTASKEQKALYSHPERGESQYGGDISDILLKVDPGACETDVLQDTVAMLKTEAYEQALKRLNSTVENKSGPCMGQAHYLRAYAYFMHTSKNDSSKLIKAEEYFQTAIVSFPESELTPFGFAAIGLIHVLLKNYALAEGYFTIVKEGYEAYPGRPEVLYHLALIYSREGYNEKALRYYRDIFETYPDNKYTVDAGIGLGKALFNERRYLDAKNILEYIVKENEQKIYAAPELLLTLGKAYFRLKKSTAARKTFMRVMNLFTDIRNRDLLMTRIADTYAMEDRIERARKMYRYVRENFPDSEGYIKSSIGLARYLEDREKREELYKMVKTRFTDSSYARVAMMRLAEIYESNEEYERCIKEIEDLLATHPRALRYEAVRLMQRAYELLFEKKLEKGEYTDIIRKYEAEYVRIDRFNSKKSALSIGLSYLEGHLYEQAFNHLLTAYKNYERNARPPELLFGMGVSMDETGRDSDALKVFNGFVKRFPKNAGRVEAYFRMGKIYLAEDRIEKAQNSFESAFEAAGRDHLAKGEVLLEKSRVYEKTGNWGQASRTLNRAVENVASASGSNYQMLSEIHRRLGKSYFEQELFIEAADSFDRALNFSQEESEAADLEFMMGDAYQKGNVLEKAKKVFEKVARRADSVWARLARQRLSTLELAEDVKNS